MMIRQLIVLFVIFASFAFVSPAGVDARATPKCRGKVATQWLTEPGSLTATAGNDVLVGSSGNDNFALGVGQGAETGVDLICAGGGDDYILIQGEGSIAEGGNGDDTIGTYYGASGYGGSGDDSMYAFVDAWVDGGSGNDAVYAYNGSTGDGGSGDDRVQGPENAYKLLGGSGKDFVIDNGGAQFMDCGSNADTYWTAGTPEIRRCEILFD